MLKQLVKILILSSLLHLNSVAQNIEFKSVKVPETEAEKRSILVSDTVTVNGKTHDINYHTILRSGTVVGEHIFGQLTDSQGQPLTTQDGKPIISNRNDFSSLIPVDDKLFMISHFEIVPGAMYLTELQQDRKTGALTALNTQPLDLSALHGGWLHCGGSVTPWNTHLGSEEYEPNARATHLEQVQSLNTYYNHQAYSFNPYYYGFAIEVQLKNAQGEYNLKKHYAMGRLSLEVAYVMPDNKTVYLTDDGDNVGLYLFVADRPQDLTAGTLYAMKWQQVHAEQGGRAELMWINLGHAHHEQIKDYLTKGINFEDIFDTAEPQEGQCPAHYQSINTRQGHECLIVKPAMELAASRLETRRYAALKGATTELRKEEGITFDPTTQTLYIAMSEISNGMEDHQRAGQADPHYDQGGPNHIRLPFNLCGGIYALEVAPQACIGSDYVAQNISGVLMGNMTQAFDPQSPLPAYPTKSPFAQNFCDLETIANPDNITLMPGYHTLIIAEDSSKGHQNDFIWAYHLEDKSLTRIMTTPYGAEATSVYIYPNINGFAYLMAVIQHPFAESDRKQLKTPDEAYGYNGYLGVLPALQ